MRYNGRDFPGNLRDPLKFELNRAAFLVGTTF